MEKKVKDLIAQLEKENQEMAKIINNPKALGYNSKFLPINYNCNQRFIKQLKDILK